MQHLIHTVIHDGKETLSEHRARPWWSSPHGFSTCAVQELVPSPWTSSRLCLSFPCCGSQASGHIGERCRPLLLRAFSGLAACFLSLNISGFVPSPLLPWVDWAVAFCLSPFQPKPHFHRWFPPQGQWAGCVICWPSTFWNWFCTMSLFQGSFGEVVAANWSCGGPSSLLVLNGQ